MESPDLVLCVALPLDLDTVLRVRREAILALAPTRMSPEEAAAWAHRPDRPARCVAAIEARRLSLALRDGEVVGWLEVSADFVDGLYVVPGRWGSGVGSWLMDRAESAIREQGFACARLTAARAAVGFYLRRGYRETGPRSPGRGTPMAKDL